MSPAMLMRFLREYWSEWVAAASMLTQLLRLKRVPRAYRCLEVEVLVIKLFIHWLTPSITKMKVGCVNSNVFSFICFLKLVQVFKCYLGFEILMHFMDVIKLENMGHYQDNMMLPDAWWHLLSASKMHFICSCII